MTEPTVTVTEQTSTAVIVDDAGTVTVTEPVTETVTVAAGGPAGPAGATGPAGPTGPAGEPGVASYSTLVGNGSDNQYEVNHGLGTRDAVVVVYQAAAPYDEVDAWTARTGTDTATVQFGSPPAVGQYRVVVIAPAA